MKISIDDVYEIVAERFNIPLKLVRVVGRRMFDTLAQELQEGEELAYYVPKLGTFVRRQKKFETYFLNARHHYSKDNKKYLRLLRIYNKMQKYKIEKTNFRKQFYPEIPDREDVRILKKIED